MQSRLTQVIVATENSWICLIFTVLLAGDMTIMLFHWNYADNFVNYLVAFHTIMLILLGAFIFKSFSRRDRKLKRMKIKISEILEQTEQDKNILDNLLNHTPCAAMTVSPDFSILMFNNETNRLTGVDWNMAKGKKCYEVLGKGKSCENCPVVEAVATKTICRRTLTRDYKGKKVSVDYTAVPVLSDDGSVRYTLILALDISKEMELRAQNNNLFIETVTSLVNLIGSRDYSTGAHSERVREIAVAIGRRANLSETELEELSVAAILHDIGKIGIPEHVLNKTGKLTDIEYATIKAHPGIGYDAIKNIGMLKQVAEYILCHHEAYDGTGYPLKLRGEEIPVVSRILSIADVFEAITADRVYRKAMGMEQARSIMLEGRGNKFDPYLLDIFIKLMDEGYIKASADTRVSA